MTNSSLIPAKLDLKRDEKLEILWNDGQRTVYPLAFLRSMCPCATCKELRLQEARNKSLLKILPGNYDLPLTVVAAELVGNYALRIDWSDQHATGIYSFQYLRDIAKPAEPKTE